MTSEQLAVAKRHAAAFASADDGQARQAVAASVAIHAAVLLVWPVVHLSQHSAWVVAWSAVCAMNLVRMFILAHDCAHGSAFSKRAENLLVGRLLGAFATMPFDAWKPRHLQHHAVSGIEEEHAGDHGRTVFWTKQQWDSWPLWRKALLRVARDPFLFFSVGAAIIMLLLGGGAPAAQPKPGDAHRRQAWRQHIQGVVIMLMVQAAQALLLLALFPSYACWLGWVRAYLLLAAPVAAGIGISLYHLQHYVNTPYRVPRKQHSRELASVLGSTCLMVPWWAKWCTLGIEYHHIHHLNTAVPCYKLQACHEAAAPGTWSGVTVVTPGLALRSLFNVMWDERQQRYVCFPEHEFLLGILQRLAKAKV